MYTTANGVTSDPSPLGTSLVSVADYHPPAGVAPELRLDVLLRRAERLVADASIDDGSLGFREAARDAELAVFEYIFVRPTYTDSKSIGDLSITYAKEDKLKDILRDSLGSYYKPIGFNIENTAALDGEALW